MSERLHKLLAQHGIGSRREIEKWMLAGRVLLNNQPAQPGASYTHGDRVVVDGKDVTARLRIPPRRKRSSFTRRKGSRSRADAEPTGESLKSVMESLPAVRGSRWLAVNTMQAGDSGLLLLTSDGRLADALRRRAESIPAAYVARVLAPFPEFEFEAIPLVVQYDEEAIEFESPRAGGRRRRQSLVPRRISLEPRG